MPDIVQGQLTSIRGFLARVEEAARPGSRVLADFRRFVFRRAMEGHAETLLAGLDADGSVTAPLRPSTLKRRKGTGPARVPFNRASRMIANAVGEWAPAAGGMMFTIAYRGISFARFLIEGTPRMAGRPTGPGPRAMADIRDRFARILDDIRRFGGGR